MAQSVKRFAELLLEGIAAIADHTSRPKGVIRDELGYAIGRKGGSAIEYWVYGDGRIPRQQTDVEALARILVEQGKLEQSWLQSFLKSAGYPDRDELVAELFPDAQDQPPHNLPIDPTPFIGRNRELTDLADLIANRDCRLITLVGPGGSGKTRLAIAAARDAHETFANGAAYVALAPISSPDLIASTVAASLNLALEGQSTPQSQVLRYLRGRKLLLVLDNFEHLLPASADQINENSALSLLIDILQQTADVTMLVTSRERLNLQGEWLYDVDGLETPAEDATGVEEGQASTGSALGGYSAPILFTQTARRLRRDFGPTADEQAAIRRICHLVNGMPLAIELAASWVRTLSCYEIAEEIANELGESLDFLSTTLHDIPARHRSMQAVFDHSWRLLSEKEQQVFARCSVFRGGFTRESAQEIADATLPILAALVDKSLLSCSRDGRYAVHELARQYAANRLDELQETERTRNRHLAFFAQLSEEAEPRIRSGPGCVQWHDRIEIEHDNIRAALDWSLHGGEFETGFRIAGALWEFWMIRSHAPEGQRWAEQFLQRPEADTPTYTQAKVMHTAGVCAYYQGHYEVALIWLCKASDRSRQLGPRGRYTLSLSLMAQGYIMVSQRKQDAAETLAKKIMSLGDKLDDDWVRGHAWTQLATLEQHRNNKKQASEYFLESFTRFQADGESVMRGSSLMYLGETLCELGDFATAHTYLHQALAIYEELNDKDRYSAVLTSLGYLALSVGHLGEAEESLAAALAHIRKTGQMRTFMKALGTMGRVAQRQGNYNRAHALYVEGLTIILETKRFAFILDSIEAFACLAAEQGEADRAAVLFGTVEAQQELQWLLSTPYLRAEHEHWVACVRKELGESAFTGAWDKGAAMSIEEAANFALTV
ncbi:MAG: tetratricopeptide repeat protein [Chloroflexota bacterium]